MNNSIINVFCKFKKEVRKIKYDPVDFFSFEFGRKEAKSDFFEVIGQRGKEFEQLIIFSFWFSQRMPQPSISNLGNLAQGVHDKIKNRTAWKFSYVTLFEPKEVTGEIKLAWKKGRSLRFFPKWEKEFIGASGLSFAVSFKGLYFCFEEIWQAYFLMREFGGKVFGIRPFPLGEREISFRKI